MYSAARAFYYWHIIWRDCERLVSQCEACQIFSPSKPNEAELQTTHFARRPVDVMSTDLFYYGGKHHFHLVDHFSKYIWKRRFPATPLTAKVTDMLKSIFSETGFPSVLVADYRPQY